jgi:hypothetical protein
MCVLLAKVGPTTGPAAVPLSSCRPTHFWCSEACRTLCPPQHKFSGTGDPIRRTRFTIFTICLHVCCSLKGNSVFTIRRIPIEQNSLNTFKYLQFKQLRFPSNISTNRLSDVKNLYVETVLQASQSANASTCEPTH